MFTAHIVLAPEGGVEITIDNGDALDLRHVVELAQVAAQLWICENTPEKQPPTPGANAA